MHRRAWPRTFAKSSISLASGIPVIGPSQVELAPAAWRSACRPWTANPGEGVVGDGQAAGEIIQRPLRDNTGKHFGHRRRTSAARAYQEDARVRPRLVAAHVGKIEIQGDE